MFTGNSFHSRGAAAPNAESPACPEQCSQANNAPVNMTTCGQLLTAWLITRTSKHDHM